MSVLTFHDSVELFLQLASEHRNVGRSGQGFLEYWETISDLTQKESMRRLNGARVGLKHQGTLPSRLDVESLRASVTNFFEENTPIVFGVSLGSISMVALVGYEGVREDLERARVAAEAGNQREALNEVGIAWARLVDSYNEEARAWFIRSPFALDQRIPSLSWGGDASERKVSEAVNKLGDAVVSLQQAVEPLVLGVDYRRYVRFEAVTPRTFRRYGSDTYETWPFDADGVTAEDFEYAFNFVIETALALQQEPFD